MKWFKHYSSARGDERLSSLEDKTGLEGYGFYFKVLEVIAEVMNESNNCSVTYSMTRWGRQLNITTKKFLTLAQRCSDVGLITLRQDGDNFTIDAPNLLKYRDNHTKNLQATCKEVVSNLPLEKEKEEELDKEDKTIVPSKAVDACPHEKIIELYHSTLPTMPSVKIWTPKRSKLLQARWREDAKRQDVDYWERFFGYVAKSDFLCGRTEKPFNCDLEWMLNASNFVKIIEGKYHAG